MSTIKGIGSMQTYQGVQLSIDKENKPVIEKVPFKCHRCDQTVDSEKGYFVEHYRVKQDRYGGPKRMLCAASNNKVREELKSLHVEGTCSQCGIDVEMTFTEDYPGGLRKYGGLVDVECPACDGKTHATCDSAGCGEPLTEVEVEDKQLGIPITTKHWVHSGTQDVACANAGSVWFVYDENAVDVNGNWTKIAGPFPDLTAAETHYQQLINAPTATGNENYAVDSEMVPGTNASPFVPTIKTNPVNIVRCHDGFTIEEWDGTDPTTEQSPFDPSDPASIAAALSGTNAQEG